MKDEALDKKAENARELGLDYEPNYKVTVVDDQHPKGVPLEQWGRPAPVQETVAWLYPEGLEALKAGKCWTAYGTKQDDNCNIPVYLNAAVAPKVEPVKTECDGFDSHPAAPVLKPVAWVPVTETLLHEQHPWLYKTMWIAMKDGRVLKGRYEWRQGRNPDRFYADGAGDEWAYDASHVMPLQAPAHPSTAPPAAAAIRARGNP